MNHHNVNTIKSWARRTVLLSSLAWLALAPPLIAHGGFDHVIGTVVKLENNVLTVKTAKGNVDVRLEAKTAITKNDKKAAGADLIPGTRVVVDVPEGKKEKVAHSVKVGVPAVAAMPAHSPQK